MSLSVLPEQSKSEKASSSDRRSMFQNYHRSSLEPIANLPKWTQMSQQVQKLGPKEAGWKFHFSIAQDANNVEKAWNALVPILLKYKVGQTKIVRPENIQDASKVITTYTFSGGPELNQWGPFEFLEIDMKEDAFLPVGTTDNIRKQIAGSQKSNTLYAFFDTVVDQSIHDDTSAQKKSTFK